jgi:hypothetical protein
MGRRAGYKAVHKLRVHPPLLPVRFGVLLYSRMLLHLVIDASQETRGPLPARQMLPQLSSLSQQRGLQASSRCRSRCILHHIQCFIIFLHFQAKRPVQAAIATATITFTLIVTYAASLPNNSQAHRPRPAGSVLQVPQPLHFAPHSMFFYHLFCISRWSGQFRLRLRQRPVLSL